MKSSFQMIGPTESDVKMKIVLTEKPNTRTVMSTRLISFFI